MWPHPSSLQNGSVNASAPTFSPLTPPFFPIYSLAPLNSVRLCVASSWHHQSEDTLRGSMGSCIPTLVPLPGAVRRVWAHWGWVAGSVQMLGLPVGLVSACPGL